MVRARCWQIPKSRHRQTVTKNCHGSGMLMTRTRKTKMRPPGAEYVNLQPKVALALGGGMARGWALIGVLKSLAMLNIHPMAIAGTSMGAIAGGAFAADKLPELEAWAKDLGRLSFWRHIGFSGRAGLFDSAKLGGQMAKHLGRRDIGSLDIPFIAVASDLVTGQEVWLRDGDMVDAIRASFAVPGFFAPMLLNQRYLADGFLVNPVPVSAARAMGADLVIAVSLAADEVAPQRPSVALGLSDRKLTMGGSLGAAFHIIQQRLSKSRMAADPPDVHIAVPCQTIGVLDFHRAEELIALGIESVYRAAPRIEAAMELIKSGHGHY
jgi:NTE family protein